MTGFGQLYPGESINQTNLPNGTYTGTLQQLLGAHDSSFDLFFIDPTVVSPFVEAGLITPIVDTTFGKRMTPRTILPRAIVGVTYKGKKWAMPLWTSTCYLYYNNTLLKAAGITPPSADPKKRWTWQQVAAAGAQAQKAGAQWGLLLSQPDRYYQIQPLPQSLGGGTGLTGPGNLTVDITNKAWLQFAQFYQSLYSTGLASLDLLIGQTALAFEAGQAAFLVGTPNYLMAAANAGIDWGISYYPVMQGGTPMTPTDSWGLAANPSSPNMSAALDAIGFAGLSQVGALDLVAAVSNLPTYIPAFTQELHVLGATSYPTKVAAGITGYELARTAVHRPQSVGYAIFEATIDQTLASIKTGQNPAQALAQAEATLKDQFSRLPK
jgi:multiple sugar transport system substrate-binding protein